VNQSSLDIIKAVLADPAPVKWLFTGDSITHGAFHTLGHRDYTEHFAERVRWEMRRVRDGVIKSAVNGWRITDLAADLEWNVLQYRPEIVSLNFGMNDCTEGAEGLAAFKKGYHDVLRRIRSETGAAIILHTPPGLLPLAPTRQDYIACYVQAVREIAQEIGAVLVDHFANWEAASKREVMVYWQSDAFHPNEYGHRAMAHSLFRELGIFDSQSAVCRLFVP
jgi:lysophospholipase L1-like esterase